MKLVNPAIEVPKTSNDDPRLGHLINLNGTASKNTKVVIIGFPSDEGVRRNNGRPGAAGAPDEIRRHLYKMTPPPEEMETYKELLNNLVDLGNLSMSVDLESAQNEFGKVIGELLDEEILPIILGGGHETAFAHFLGYAESGLGTAIINIDAHTDVRQLKNGKAHSGSSFRQAIEHRGGYCESYMVAGLQPHSVSKAHLDYINENDGSYLFRDDTNITTISGLLHKHESERVMITFDMDAVDQSFAPGVSAPCTNGLHQDLWLTSAYLAGRNEKVTSFDISEVNPTHDRDGQTARLAALTIWQFLLGLSQR